MTLIEFLVALLISSGGILSATALQLNAVKFNALANSRSAALFLANDIAERLRANRALALAGGYDTELDASTAIAATNAMLAADLRAWQQQLQRRLPDAQAAITEADGLIEIAVDWSEARAALPLADNGADDGRRQFRFVAGL